MRNILIGCVVGCALALQPIGFDSLLAQEDTAAQDQESNVRLYSEELRYADAVALEKSMEKLFPRTTVSSNAVTNVLHVRCDDKDAEEIKEFLQRAEDTAARLQAIAEEEKKQGVGSTEVIELANSEADSIVKIVKELSSGQDLRIGSDGNKIFLQSADEDAITRTRKLIQILEESNASRQQEQQQIDAARKAFIDGLRSGGNMGGGIKGGGGRKGPVRPNVTEAERLANDVLYPLQFSQKVLLQSVGEGHPSVAQLRTEIDLVEEQIAKIRKAERKEQQGTPDPIRQDFYQALRSGGRTIETGQPSEEASTDNANESLSSSAKLKLFRQQQAFLKQQIALQKQKLEMLEQRLKQREELVEQYLRSSSIDLTPQQSLDATIELLPDSNIVIVRGEKEAVQDAADLIERIQEASSSVDISRKTVSDGFEKTDPSEEEPKADNPLASDSNAQSQSDGAESQDPSSRL